MWRRWTGLAYKRATGDPPFLIQNECDSSPFDHQSILMKDLRGTSIYCLNIFFFTILNNGFL